MASDPVFSFCVKSMRPEVTDAVIREAFENSVIGEIENIDFVDKFTTLPDDLSKCYKMAFIHLKSWSKPLSDNAIREFFLQKVRTTGANIIYDNEGHYITLRENHNPKYKTDSYIAHLESELVQIKETAIQNYNNLQVARTQCIKLQQDNQELVAFNQQFSEQITAHNTYSSTLQVQIQHLQAQIQHLTSQYIPTTFHQVPQYNPSAPPFTPSGESDVDTQMSESHPETHWSFN